MDIIKLSHQRISNREIKKCCGKTIEIGRKTEEFKKPLFFDWNNIEIDNLFDFLSEIVAIQLGYKIETRLNRNRFRIFLNLGGYQV